MALTVSHRPYHKGLTLCAPAESEAAKARKMWPASFVISSSNAVNVPCKRPSRNLRADGFRRALFLSRFHYKKGLMHLVDAWAEVRPQGWKMELVGTDRDDYLRVIKSRISELGLQDDFIITGALNDDEKWAAYARADLFVLPTYSENFGIVVAEALWAGVPVITTKGTPWKELEDRECGKWIDLPEEGSSPSDWPTLASALTSMTLMPDDERREMGKRGRELVEEKYTWDACVMKMKKGYLMLRN